LANFSFYCEQAGADVETVLDGVGLDKRIGRIFFNPGVGYGGSCFPKDVKALIKIGQSLSTDPLLLQSVEKVNAQAKDNFFNKIVKYAKGKRIVFWGLSFKPNTDDIREAPSTYVIDKLLAKKYDIHVYDPVAMENVKRLYNDKITFHSDPYAAVKNGDLLAILTEWNEFMQADLKKVKSLLKKPVIIDGRNIYQPSQMKALGFTYVSTGRRPVL
jgi:UDPglucose 6-dehydrogenase